ncbi:rab11 family-interacting protein 2 isoform X2 [Osmerus eperlanus]|uniref:rab11 family-interacting protein 2 isoform X2 n=1 Tax=Osmerus eperlanus TaxID=29151 RepID=UPI002E0D2EAD
MSLGDQSQQWYPTSVQVTVLQARNLRIKGKNGTNDAYAIMQLAKDKFSTSVADKCVAPVWKEEATFDLPLFHQSNAERCTLHIIVMHRAQVGLDKHLGQAVINLIELHDNKSRKKTDWFKLVDKNGKEDKVRGEVLLDVQFMRNNLSASMFDLSMQDKPRSRISKLKDKVRGKKKEGFSDSASAIVPSVSQVMTDSEGEEGGHLDSPEAKKKSKLKSLFTPKSNLQRNISQSMSTLGTLPEKNSSLSGSRSSGLNVESPDVKKKFKFLGHKRTGSNDSKVSLGPFSLLGRSKQSANDQNNLCINGSHVYAEEAEPKSGSTLSLNSSGQGSVEDVRRHDSDVSADSLKGLSVPSYRQESADRDRALLEQRRHQEEEERRQAEERRRAEAKRLQEEEEGEEEERKRLAEQERRKRFLEDEARRKKLKEEEEERRKKGKDEEEERRKKSKEVEEEERRRQGEERRRLQAEEERLRLEEEQKQQEETKREEEKKRQEEASMSDRLSTLFGIIKKKEEPQPQTSSTKEEVPKPAPRKTSGDSEVPGPRHSSNPFEEISLSPDTPNTSEETPGHPQKPPRTAQVPSAMVFLNRTAKVSAVKPRPHPVKPMNTGETQAPTSTPIGRELKTLDFTTGKIKIPPANMVTGTAGSGPYTQLTQEELITLVVKQQTELTKKNDKIVELEEYIDNLLVRVIEEQPSILLGLNSSKHAF